MSARSLPENSYISPKQRPSACRRALEDGLQASLALNTARSWPAALDSVTSNTRRQI